MRKDTGEDMTETVADVEAHAIPSIGVGLELVTNRVVELNHARAQSLLDMETVEWERNLRPLHVNYLVRHMERGTFHPEWVTIVVCELNGKTYRMNGQHTARARLEMPSEYSCKVRWYAYRAATAEDMRALYASIDRGAPRTRSNIITAHLVGEDGPFAGFMRNTIKKMPQGFSFWLWPTKNERQVNDGDTTAVLLKTDYLDLALSVANFLNERSKYDDYHIFRAPVIAAMFATFRVNKARAREFWTAVCDGAGFETKNDPGLKLSKYLMKSSITSGAKTRGKPVSNETMYRACILAWNASRKGVELSRILANEKGPRPSAI